MERQVAMRFALIFDAWQLRNAAEQTQALHYHIMNLVRLQVICLHIQDVVTWDRQVFRASELRVYCMQ